MTCSKGPCVGFFYTKWNWGVLWRAHHSIAHLIHPHSHWLHHTPLPVDLLAHSDRFYTGTPFFCSHLLGWLGREEWEWSTSGYLLARRREQLGISFVDKNHKQSSIKLSPYYLHSPWSQGEGRCRSGSHVAATGQTEPTPSCPAGSLPPHGHHGYHGKPGGRVKNT